LVYFFSALVYCTKKNLATLEEIQAAADSCWGNPSLSSSGRNKIDWVILFLIQNIFVEKKFFAGMRSHLKCSHLYGPNV
jgi:hypothetical protein